ncbi:unnamed protein product, partial [marine sediment metagenome]
TLLTQFAILQSKVKSNKTPKISKIDKNFNSISKYTISTLVN